MIGHVKLCNCLSAVLLLTTFGCGLGEDPVPASHPPDPASQARQEMASVAGALFELPPGRWEEMSNPERRQHLTALITKYERMPPWDRTRRGKFPTLYYAMATLLSQQGQGEQALSYLERARPDPGSEGVHHLIRGRVLEVIERTDPAFDSYLTAFSHDLRRDIWAEVRRLAPKLEVSAEEAAVRVLSIQQKRSLAFPGFALRTPEGESRTLQDYSSKVLLVNFFFPG